MPKKDQFGIITKENVERVEQETIEKVNHTIIVLENSIVAWEASPEKPAELAPKFEKYRRFRSALSDWATKALRARGKKEPLEERVKRLREFVEICYAYG
jgi:uncharacterized protein (DUF2235 family)